MTRKAFQNTVFIFSLLIGNACFCQSNPYKSFQFRIAPLTILDPITGTIQAGVEKRFSSGIAVSFDYGLKFDKLSFYSLKNERKDYKYHKYKIEIRYFFKTKPSTLHDADHPYLSVQYFYFPQHYRKDNDWLVRNHISYHYDHSKINRNVFAASVLLGDELTSGRFVYDGYFGFGIKKLIIIHQPTNAVADTRPWHIDFSPTPVDTYEGTFHRIHIPGGFKIGYILNK